MADGTPIIVKKKKAVAHAHHGGSWKVAYADFVTAMMAFFLTLWIMGLSDSTRTQVAGYFNDPMGYSKTPPLSKNIIKQPNMESPKPGESKAPGDQQATGAQEVGQALTNIAKKDGKLAKFLKNTQVFYDGTGIRIEFVETNDTVFFKLGSAELTQDARDYIKLIEPTLAKLNLEMSFEGHTDARPYSGITDNYDLSSNRALALKHALQQDGISQDKIAGVAGYGDRDLAYPNSPFDARNRRVTIWVHTSHPEDLKKVLDDPGVKKDLKEVAKPDRPDIRPTDPGV